MTAQNPINLLPRNLTAHAAEMVEGNPVNTRPESGVDNSHPGLEFDQRMLSRTFFPGLVFDFQYGLGAKLVKVDPGLFSHPFDLQASDVPPADQPEKALWLWYIGGYFGDDPSEGRLRDMYDRDGYDFVRVVTELENKTIAVIVGRQPEYLETPSAKVFLKRFLNPKRLLTSFKADLMDEEEGPEFATVLRDKDGEVQIAVLVGPRAQYLTQDGVIDPALLPAGELTQTLCSPWQWDFADCGCYYWAGSKPDIVKPPHKVTDGTPLNNSTATQRLNFQRKRDVPPPDEPATTPDAWHENQMSQPDMVQHWESLPFVLDETETDVYHPTHLPEIEEPWTREEVLAELQAVTSMEHAVCVEYLYACYSLDAPLIPPERRYAQQNTAAPSFDEDSREGRIFAAAHEVLMIAIDEMRHLRWANEAVMLLGGEPILDRAECIGTQKGQANLPFVLKPLTRQQLDDFILIEKASPYFADPDPNSLDGIYTRMLISIEKRPEDYPEAGLRDNLVQLIKLIIDEGVGHYERFSNIQRHLDGLSEDDYLIVKTGPEPAADPFYKDLQDLADGYYDTLLRGLYLVFEQGNASRGILLEQARRSMYNLHDTAHRLAKGGYGVPFNLPDWLQHSASGQPKAAKPEADADAPHQAEAMSKPSERTLVKLAQNTDPEVQSMVRQHQGLLSDMIARIKQIVS